MILTRRLTLACALTALAAAAAPISPARALEPEAARRFAQALIDDIAALPRNGDAQARAAGLSDIFARRAAVPQIARFVMGQTWRELSEAQQARAQQAITAYVGRAYAAMTAKGDIAEGDGAMTLGEAKDFGAKGVLVSLTLQSAGGEPVVIELQISDRAGAPQLVDVIAEGVSLLQSQRQEFAAMLERRGGDVDRFLDDLEAGRALDG